MTGHSMLDDIDKKILRLLRDDARRTMRDIAFQVDLTVAPVKRRIERLERSGVITGYTVRVDPAKVENGLEAVVELRFVGNLELDVIVSFAEQIPEVTEILTLAGDPDAIARIHATNIQDLQRVVNVLRSHKQVTSTRTLVLLNSWSR